MRTHDSKPAYRDLKLDADGKTIWAACICDKVGAKAAKALVKLHRWQPRYLLAHPGRNGSVRPIGGGPQWKLYLAAGGSDFVAEFDVFGRRRSRLEARHLGLGARLRSDGQLVVGGTSTTSATIKPTSVGLGCPEILSSTRTESSSRQQPLTP